jgi:hypothetical protein
MNEITRRDVLRNAGVSTAFVGGIAGLPGNVSASGNDCNGCGSDSYNGDVLKVREISGEGTAEYEVENWDGAIYDCFGPYDDDTYRYYGNGKQKIRGAVSDETDKFLLSGSGLNTIRVCDVDDPGATFVVSIGFCSDHCATPYHGEARFTVQGLTENNDAAGSLCSGYGSGENYYDFCITGNFDDTDDVDSEDSTRYGSCAEGYVCGEDYDKYYASGRLSRFTAKPGGSNMFFTRAANDNC